MTAHIEYVTASDGVRIAFARRGRGPTMISMPPLPCRHIELEWEAPEERRWLELIGEGRTLVQYDPRGLGLSDRSAATYGLDALVRDLDAVVECVAAEPVALCAAVNAGVTAIAYAARYPERVSHLILWCCSARAADGLGPQLQALLGLVDQDWALATETAAHVLRGWSSGDAARRLAAMLRACASPEVIRALAAAAFNTDVTDLLPQVRSPTLVLHRRGLTWFSTDRAVELASRIPNARLALLDGDSMAPWSGDIDAVRRAFDEFLGVGAPGGPFVAEAPDTFRREGEYWTLAFGGRLCRLRDSKGLQHIAYLLARPAEYVAAAELLAASDGEGVRDLGDAGPALDEQARRSYRERLADLRAELAEAERFADAGRATAARGEMELLTRQLAAAVGLGGRDRRAASAAERARLTVTKRIRDALARVHRHHSLLGDHLTRSVRTGLLCAYVPSPERPARWSF